MKYAYLFLLFFGCLFVACDPDEEPAVYDSTPAPLSFGNFPTPMIPADNTPTIAGVMLGRMLFFEKKLSKDGSQACADCHRQPNGFSDSLQFSIGVAGLPGKRQAMPIMNLAWHKNGMFWDGRSPLMRDQALKPIQDALEMNETLANAIAKLAADKTYTDQFIRAFGDGNITEERIGKAIEQFEMTMISNNARYDKWQRGEVTLTDSEERGRKMFFAEFSPSGAQKGAECFHCHGGFNFTNDQYMNNGLDADADQTDEGRMKVTLDAADMAKFKTPSLRNIAHTAPYMHDGRFGTLEAVIEHYNTDTHASATADPLLQYNLQPGGLQLNAADKADLLAFLHALTDTDFLTNPAFKSPF